jgi:hypothetical protein
MSFLNDPALQVWVPEALVALAVSIWGFASDERPLLHEAHELGVGPRALIQGVTVAVTLALIDTTWYAVHGYFDRQSLVHVVAQLGGGLLAIAPAFVETRARARRRNDAVLAISILVAGTLTVVAGRLSGTYALTLFETGRISTALDDMSYVVADARSPGSLMRDALAGLVFVGPALARSREARPRIVLLAGLAGVAIAWAAATFQLGDRGFPIHFHVRWAIALALGAAYADRLVRKIERRLPGRHADAH